MNFLVRAPLIYVHALQRYVCGCETFRWYPNVICINFPNILHIPLPGKVHRRKLRRPQRSRRLICRTSLSVVRMKGLKIANISGMRVAGKLFQSYAWCRKQGHQYRIMWISNLSMILAIFRIKSISKILKKIFVFAKKAFVLELCPSRTLAFFVLFLADSDSEFFSCRPYVLYNFLLACTFYFHINNSIKIFPFPIHIQLQFVLYVLFIIWFFQFNSYILKCSMTELHHREDIWNWQFGSENQHMYICIEVLRLFFQPCSKSTFVVNAIIYI